MSSSLPRSTALNALLLGASAMIVIAGLQAASEFILPLLFATFLSILCEPAVRGLVKLRVPRVLAVGIVVLLLAGAMVGSTALVGDTVSRFTVKWPEYQAPLEGMAWDVVDRLAELGVPPPADITGLVDPTAIVGVVGQTLNAAVSLVSRMLIVLITTAFILLESVSIGDKLKVAMADRGRNVTPLLAEGANSVQRYLAIKTGASLSTGLLVGAFDMAIGLDFAILWGVLAFLLNYIPSIGSIVAAVPAVAVALVTLGPGWALATALVYLAVNLTIGNFLEPRIMGRRLGLSPLVVILSLFFWGWVWGPAGMLLSVPMTVVVKLLLELTDETRWIALLLGPATEVKEMSTGEVPSIAEWTGG